MQPTQQSNATFLGLSLELSSASWKIGASDGRRKQPSIFTASAADAAARLDQVWARISLLIKDWALPADVPVTVLYEAGQDGFWIARALQARGIRVLVCDPKSIPVPRDARPAKTDRLDAKRLLENLLAWLRGEHGRFRVVHIPRLQVEASRHLPRDRGVLQKEIGQHRDRMRKLLRLQGCWVDRQADVAKLLEAGQLRCWDGSALPREVQLRLKKECERLALVQEHLKDLERALPQLLPQPVQQRIDSLKNLCGVGAVGSMRLETEFLWRDFTNRRQVGAALGLVPQPYDSGQSHQDQGISKASNRRVRALMIEMGWMWVRYQPDSEITKWFLRRTQGAGKRMKRVAIVALARRLAIALWRYVTDGVVPAGAALKRA